MWPGEGSSVPGSSILSPNESSEGRQKRVSQEGRPLDGASFECLGVDPTSRCRASPEDETPRTEPRGLEVSQRWVRSKGGTLVPYFLVSHAGDPRPRPTILYG